MIGSMPPTRRVRSSARLALALCALVTLLPASAALAEEPMPPGSEPVESDAAPAPADESAPSEETVEPSTPAPASSTDAVPAAKPAQTQDDSGAPREYIEQGVPDGTGEQEPPEPVGGGGSGDTQAGSSQPQPSAGVAPAAAVPADAGSAGELPRTGLASSGLALTGVLLLALGFLVRRTAAAEPPA